MSRSMERGFAHASSELCGGDIILDIVCRFGIDEIVKGRKLLEKWHHLFKRGER